MASELIGWFGAAILLLTIGRQVFTQWRDRRVEGVSRWLFLGQLSASLCFVVYSWSLQNWVFVVTNALMLLTAGIGQWIYLLDKDRQKGAGQSADRSAWRPRPALRLQDARMATRDDIPPQGRG